MPEEHFLADCHRKHGCKRCNERHGKRTKLLGELNGDYIGTQGQIADHFMEHDLINPEKNTRGNGAHDHGISVLQEPPRLAPVKAAGSTEESAAIGKLKENERFEDSAKEAGDDHLIEGGVSQGEEHNRYEPQRLAQQVQRANDNDPTQFSGITKKRG